MDGSPFTATQISGGGAFAVAIATPDDKGLARAWAWGDNYFGQLASQSVPSRPDPDTWSLTPVEVSLPQPTDTTRLYIGEDDTVGITGVVSGDKVTFTMPAHNAGRVPLFLSWIGDGVVREHIGYYTYTLAPTIAVSPASVRPGETATATITLPEAEIPYIGDAVLDVSLEGELTSVAEDGTAVPTFTAEFDAEGKLVFPVTSAEAGSYKVGAVAVVREAGEDDVVVSAELVAPAVFTDNAEVPEVPPTTTKPPTTTPPTTAPPTTVPTTPGATTPTTTPDTPDELSTTGSEQPILVALFLLGAGAAAFSLTRLRLRNLSS